MLHPVAFDVHERHLHAQALATLRRTLLVVAPTFGTIVAANGVPWLGDLKTNESNTTYNIDFPGQAFEQNCQEMSRCAHTYLTSAMASSASEGTGGKPSLAPILAHLPLANQCNDVALLADHVDCPNVQHAIGVAEGDAVHANRHWQYNGCSTPSPWVVPIGTVKGATLACLLEFEWHCGRNHATLSVRVRSCLLCPSTGSR